MYGVATSEFDRFFLIFSCNDFSHPGRLHCLTEIFPRCVVRSLPKLFLHVWDVMEALLKRFGMTFDVRVLSAVPVPKNCANVPWKSLNWSNSGLSPPKVLGFSRTKKFVDPTRAHGSESVGKNAIACSVPKKLQNFRVFRGKCPFMHCYVELHPNLLGSPWSKNF